MCKLSQFKNLAKPNKKFVEDWSYSLHLCWKNCCYRFLPCSNWVPRNKVSCYKTIYRGYNALALANYVLLHSAQGFMVKFEPVSSRDRTTECLFRNECRKKCFQLTKVATKNLATSCVIHYASASELWLMANGQASKSKQSQSPPKMR